MSEANHCNSLDEILVKGTIEFLESHGKDEMAQIVTKCHEMALKVCLYLDEHFFIGDLLIHQYPYFVSVS